MYSKVFFNGFVLFQILCFTTTNSYKYGFDLTNEYIFSPCEMDNVNYLNEYVDMSDLKFEFLDDGTVYAHGDVEVIKDIGQGMNPVSFQIFKKDRDTWAGTIYNMKRNDMCTTAFNPQELWYDFVKSVPKEDQKCPLKKGVILPFNATSELTIPDLPDPRLEGEYKMQLYVNFVDLNEVLCVNVFGTVYRL